MKKLSFEVKQAYFQRALGNFEHRKFAIAVQAMRLLMQVGLEGLNFTLLAKKCRISRSLIHHYFKDKMDLTKVLLDLTTIHLQEWVAQALDSRTAGQSMLEAYCRATLDWAIENRVESNCLLLLNFVSATKTEILSRNNELSEIGKVRIKKMLKGLGLRKDQDLVACQIQMQLTGALVMILSEAAERSVQVKLRESCIVSCMKLANS